MVSTALTMKLAARRRGESLHRRGSANSRRSSVKGRRESQQQRDTAMVSKRPSATAPTTAKTAVVKPKKAVSSAPAGQAASTSDKPAAGRRSGVVVDRRQAEGSRGVKMADRVAVGMNVDIKRSDGRVHGAVISEVKRETGSVTVEWFERGETKGKEIDIASLIAINPLLAAKDPPITKPQSILTQSVLPTSSTNLLAMNDENDDLFELPSVLAPGAKAGAGRQSLVAPTTKSSSAPRRAPTAAAAPAPQTMISSQNANTNSAPVARRTITAQNGENGNGYAPPSISARSAGIPPPSVRNSITSTAATTPATSAPTGIVPPKTARVSTVQSTPSLVDLTSPELESGNDTILIDEPKKSSTVQEIERLEKQRAERRAQQNSVKKQRELDKAIDPGNPNWQFLAMIREYQSQIDYRPLKMSDQVIDSRISVCVRKRPLNKKEINRREIEVITIPNRDHIIVHQPQTKVDLTKYLENQKFRFDYAFDENTSNEMVYKFTAQPLVRTIFEGGFATCFAYGQTGSGKTHTMGGDFSGKVQDCTKGIYALTASDVFKSLQKEYRNQGLSVGCSFFEIYGGKVFDLLSNKAMLRVLEDGKKEVNVVGLKEEHVACEKDVLDLIKRGTDVRTAGTTSANANSSRSHAVFQIVLRAKSKKLYGKFSLIDLAGNERGVDTISSDRQTRLEGAEINKSLLALKECIRAMAKNSNHVPFRASKLTLVLRDSFVGENAKTCMIAMISPGMCSCEHTLNTLRYADRVKELGFDEGGGTTPMNDEDFMLPNEDDDPQAAQQRAVAEVMECENNMLDKQCDHINQLHQAASELQEIYQTATGNVDYDMEAYVKDSIKFYEKQIQNLTDGLEAARYWQEAMDREASATQQLNRQLAGKKK